MVKTTGGPALGASVASPAMTTGAVTLLQEHLTWEEKELWKSLGHTWTLPWSVCRRVDASWRCQKNKKQTQSRLFLSAHYSAWPFLRTRPCSWTGGGLGLFARLADLMRIRLSRSTSRTRSCTGERHKIRAWWMLATGRTECNHFTENLPFQALLAEVLPQLDSRLLLQGKQSSARERETVPMQLRLPGSKPHRALGPARRNSAGAEEVIHPADRRQLQT